MLRSEFYRLGDIPGSWPVILRGIFATFFAIFLCGAHPFSAQLFASFSVQDSIVMLRCRAFSRSVGSRHPFYGSFDHLQSGRRLLAMRYIMGVSAVFGAKLRNDSTDG